MLIENEFDIPATMEEAWLLLTDIERIVPCMPGATLTEVVDESTYKGNVSIRLGPVALVFKGTATFQDIDPANHRVLVKTQGIDTKGRGNVTADVRFELQPGENATRVMVQTDLRLSGMVAQFGRGAGMISDVATHWLTEFSDCLGKQLTAPTGTVANPDAPERAPSAAAPVPMAGLGLKVIAKAIIRGMKRLLNRD